jgi:hypothetical protein
MSENQNKEHKKLEELLKEAVTLIIDLWISGEGDISFEVRDDGGIKKCKIKGGPTKRI